MGVKSNAGAPSITEASRYLKWSVFCRLYLKKQGFGEHLDFMLA